MFEALAVNAAILIVLVLIQWAISVKINDVSFIDAFWGAGMGILAVASWLHEAGTCASCISKPLLPSELLMRLERVVHSMVP